VFVSTEIYIVAKSTPYCRDRSAPLEIKTARNWYTWLWLSPLVTIPTLLILYESNVEYTVRHVVGWAGYTFPIVVLLLLSALWHLILLAPALNKTSDFIRWHGRQALLLAGIRTAVPICMVLFTGNEYGVLYAIPILIIIWLIGTIWGQRQAARGDCSLKRWFGQAEALPLPESELAPVRDIDKDPDALVDVIRFSHDPQQRRAALMELEKLGMVERLDGKASYIPISTVLSTTEDEAPGARSGSGYAWLIVIVVLAVLLGVSGGSSVYRGRSRAATRQASGTATMLAGETATARAVVGATARAGAATERAQVAATILAEGAAERAQAVATLIAEAQLGATIRANATGGVEAATARTDVSPTATAQVIQMQSAMEGVSGWPLVLQSDFDWLENAWDIGTEENELLSGVRKIQDGKYLWEAQVEQRYVWWSIPESDRTLFDYFLTVEGQRVSGPMDSGYGVVLRYIDEDNFMVFMVEDRPSKALVRAKVEGEWKTIYSLPVPGDSFQFGDVNRITVIAEGPKIKFIVDDKYYGEFKDFQFGFGKTGLGIELDARDHGRFSFDNFELRGPVPGAAELIDAGEILARQGVIEMALSTFKEAQASDPGVISANAWNNLCWYGSLWGYAVEVMDACETAVALAPEHGGIRGSRGVARAIMGDYTGAIEDFNFYVEWTKEKNEYGLDGQKREAWITELENGRNPFDAELLESLKHDK